MSRTIQVSRVQMYACPICKSANVTKRLAEQCKVQCEKNELRVKLEKARKANWDAKMDKVRLEAENKEDVLKLIVKYAKEFMNVTIEFTDFTLYFGDVSNSHASPIGKTDNWRGKEKNKPTSYLGWRGHVEGKIKGKNPFDKDDEASLSDLFDKWHGGFKGIHTGSGGGSNKFHYDFYFFLDDFPKLKAKHEQMEKLMKKESAYEEQEIIQLEKVQKEAVKNLDNDAEYKALWVEKEKAEAAIKKAQAERDRISNKISEFVDFYHNKAGELKKTKFSISEKYEYDKDTLSKLKRLFNRS